MTPRPPTVLLVDSHADSRQELAGLLRDCGCRVLEAHNGLEALRMARETPPHLVVVELWPFFRAAEQLMERLGAPGGTDRTPVLVLTSPVSAEYRARARVAGCCGYVEKPCAPERVLAEVSRALGRTLTPGGTPARPARQLALR